MKAIVPLCTLVAALVLCFLFSAAVNDAKDRALEVSVRPRMAFAPADLAITVRLIPVESDRKLRVWTDGEVYGTSQERQLEGEKSPKLWTFYWKKVFPGERYEIIAAVSNSMGVIRASASSFVELVNP